MILKELPVAPSRVNPFAGGNRNFDFAADFSEEVGVQRLGRFLVIEAVELLQLTTQLNGSSGVGQCVEFNDDIYIRTGFPHARDIRHLDL